MKQKLKLFQFWNSSVPPEEVSTLMKSWAEDAAFEYRRYDSASAEAYIAEHFGARARDSFRQCRIPAMQADFFRYCAVFQEGGVYVDADTQNSGRLMELIANTPRGMLMNRQQRIANDFLFVRESKDPLFGKVIDQAIANIENRISNNVWQVTGPGIMTRMYLDGATRSWFEGFTVTPVEIVRKFVLFKAKMAYKLEQSDWRANLVEGAQSIFQDSDDRQAPNLRV